MRIGFINSGFSSYPPRAGGSIHMYQIASGLMKRGHSIHAFDYDKNPDFIKYKRTRFRLSKMFLNADLFYVRIDGAPKYKYFNLNKLKRLDKPIVWEINAPVDEMIVRAKCDKAQIEYFNRRRRQSAREVSAACCVSQELVRYSKEFLGIEKSFYVPNGSDPCMFNPETRDLSVYEKLPGKLKVLWVGSTRYKWQGYDLVIQLAERFLRIDEEITFIIIGGKKHLNIRPQRNLYLIEEIDYMSIPRYIASADICLCLYHACDWSSIGFFFSPLKLFDYMACGKPVIGSAMGEISRIIKHGHNGFLTDNSLDNLTNLILTLRDNPEAGHKMGKAARKDIIDFYNWDRASKQIEQVLQNVMGELSK